MLKFNCLIHKKTGTKINYDTWKRSLEKKESFVLGYHGTHIMKEGDKYLYNYRAEEMLFSDDFEIIYNSEFTLKELVHLFENTKSEEISDKILNMLMDKKKLKDKYRIEV